MALRDTPTTGTVRDSEGAVLQAQAAAAAGPSAARCSLPAIEIHPVFGVVIQGRQHDLVPRICDRAVTGPL